MGWFSSAVGSFFGGIASGIGRITSGVSSFVSGAISTLGNLASKVIPSFLSGIAGKAFGLLKGISGIMTGPLGPILGPIIVDLLVKVIVKVISKIAEESEVVEKMSVQRKSAIDWKRRTSMKIGNAATNLNPLRNTTPI